MAFFQWGANRTELILLIGCEYIGHVSDFNKSLHKNCEWGILLLNYQSLHHKMAMKQHQATNNNH